MPARQKPNLIEIMVMVAILGILAAIVIPGLEQAKQRARSSARPSDRSGHAAQEPSAVDGQLNTIEVSELSQTDQQPRPEQYIGAFRHFIPLIVLALSIWFVLSRLRRQMSGRA